MDEIKEEKEQEEKKEYVISQAVLNLMDEICDESKCLPSELLNIINSKNYTVVYCTKDYSGWDTLEKATLEHAIEFIKDYAEHETESDFQLYGIFKEGKLLKVKIRIEKEVKVNVVCDDVEDEEQKGED